MAAFLHFIRPRFRPGDPLRSVSGGAERLVSAADSFGRAPALRLRWQLDGTGHAVSRWQLGAAVSPLAPPH